MRRGPDPRGAGQLYHQHQRAGGEGRQIEIPTLNATFMSLQILDKMNMICNFIEFSRQSKESVKYEDFIKIWYAN